MQTKAFYLSKTFWTNFLGSIALILSCSDITPLLPPKFAPYIGGAVAVINIILRSIPSQQSGALTLTQAPAPVEPIIDTK